MIETQAVPTVTVCTEPFRALARLRRESLGLPDLPVLFLPHPMMTRTAAEIEQLVDQVLSELVQQLTGQPASRKQAS